MPPAEPSSSDSQAKAPDKPPENALNFARLIAWAAAACFALAAAGTTRLYFTERVRNTLLIDQQKLADLQLQFSRNEIEAERLVSGRELAIVKKSADEARGEAALLTRRMENDGDIARMKIASLASIADESARAVGVVVWDPENRRGVLSVEKLPAAPDNKDYQLWVIPAEAGAAPVSAGALTIDLATGVGRAVFRMARPIPSVAKFAVSLEPKGGSPAPAGKIVLISR